MDSCGSGLDPLVDSFKHDKEVERSAGSGGLASSCVAADS